MESQINKNHKSSNYEINPNQIMKPKCRISAMPSSYLLEYFSNAPGLEMWVSEFWLFLDGEVWFQYEFIHFTFPWKIGVIDRHEFVLTSRIVFLVQLCTFPCTGTCFHKLQLHMKGSNFRFIQHCTSNTYLGFIVKTGDMYAALCLHISQNYFSMKSAESLSILGFNATFLANSESFTHIISKDPILQETTRRMLVDIKTTPELRSLFYILLKIWR